MSMTREELANLVNNIPTGRFRIYRQTWGISMQDIMDELITLGANEKYLADNGRLNIKEVDSWTLDAQMEFLGIDPEELDDAE